MQHSQPMRRLIFILFLSIPVTLHVQTGEGDHTINHAQKIHLPALFVSRTQTLIVTENAEIVVIEGSSLSNSTAATKMFAAKSVIRIGFLVL